MYSGGGYNFGNYDSRTGKEPSSVVGKQHVGNLSLKYLWEDEDEEEFDSEDKENDSIHQKINSKIVNSLAMGTTDAYAGRNKDNAHGQTGNTGGLNLVYEYAGDHMNHIQKGMVPFSQSKHTAGDVSSGGSSQAFRTTGNYKRTGTHKPHQHMATDNDEPVLNLSDMLSNDNDIDLKNFRYQQNKVKKVLSNLSV